jgi:hypothetical protein
VTTAEPPPAPRTARELLFGRGTDTPEAIARRLAAEQKLDHALKNLKKVTREVAIREIADTTAGLLGFDLFDMLIDEWRKREELTNAARHTLAVPHSAELVELADREITEEQQPYISLLVDDCNVATLNFDVCVVFDVHALVAGVSGGRLTAVHAGHCDITATLAIEDTEVARKQAHVELRRALTLGHGIRLLPDAEYEPG